MEAAAAGTPFRIGTLQRVAAGMVEAIATDDALLVQALEDGEGRYDLARHMVNTGVFAIKIGQGAGCRPEELPWLGLAACLHDVGMVIVPKRILDKPEALTEKRRPWCVGIPRKGFGSCKAWARSSSGWPTSSCRSTNARTAAATLAA